MEQKPVIRFTYGKTDKIKGRKVIEALFKEGRHIHLPSLRVTYSIATATTPSLQAGVSVSKRNFKKAVDRNRIKRLLREAWRLQKHELQQSLTVNQKSMQVFLVFTGKELPAYADLFEKTGKIITRLKTVVHETERNT